MNSKKNNNNDYSMYICGVGGQGIIKTSIIIGEAAMNQGLNVIMSEIHGMSQREGSVSTQLKIGDYNSPLLSEHTADMLLSFEPIETIRAIKKANKNTKIIINTTPIIPYSQNKKYPNVDNLISILKDNYKNTQPIDGNKLALNAGNTLSLNMVMLGAAIADNNFPISKNNIIESMKNNLNPKFHKINLNAIEKGYQWIKK